MTGVERIAAAFKAVREDGRRAALMPYLMGGYPDLATSREIGLAYVRAGADLVELGVPFSDPLADGPVIAAAATAALRAGTRVRDVISLAAALAERVPVVLMSYWNPVLAYGPDGFAGALADVGASGLIVPDLPLEEATTALAALEPRGVAFVPLVAPTSTEDRLAQIGSLARGFLYVVSVTGTTGERASGPDAGDRGALPSVIARARAWTEVPVAVGFGISSPAQAAAAAVAGADGVIVGSRLVRAVGEAQDPVAAVEQQTRAFAKALREPRTGA
jgi:tryptophan synthase alpha chain